MKTQDLFRNAAPLVRAAYTKFRSHINTIGTSTHRNTYPITRGLMTIINRVFHAKDRCYYARVSVMQDAECIRGDAIIYAPSLPDGREDLLKTLESKYPQADEINIRILGFGVTQAMEMRQRYWRWGGDENKTAQQYMLYRVGNISQGKPYFEVLQATATGTH